MFNKFNNADANGLKFIEKIPSLVERVLQKIFFKAYHQHFEFSVKALPFLLKIVLFILFLVFDAHF